jgi:hypothetical protein
MDLSDERICFELYGENKSSKYSHLKSRLLRIVLDYGVLLAPGLESRTNGATSIRKIEILKGVLGSRLARYQGKHNTEKKLLWSLQTQNSLQGNNTIENLLLHDRQIRLEGISNNRLISNLDNFDIALSNCLSYGQLISAYRRCSVYHKNNNSSNIKTQESLDILKSTLSKVDIDTCNSQTALVYYKSYILYYGALGEYDKVSETLSRLKEYCSHKGLLNEISEGINLIDINLSLSAGHHDLVIEKCEAFIRQKTIKASPFIRNKILILYLSSLHSKSTFRSLQNSQSYYASRSKYGFSETQSDKLRYIISINHFCNQNFSDAIKTLNTISRLFFDSDEYKYGIRIIECLSLLAQRDYDFFSLRLETLRKLIYHISDNMSNKKVYESAYALLVKYGRLWERGSFSSRHDYIDEILYEPSHSHTYNQIFPRGLSAYFRIP